MNTWHTPQSIADELGVDDGKVIGWIKSGELTALNVASRTTGRPRWRISSESLTAFLVRRQSKPVAKPSSRRLKLIGGKEHF